MNNPMTAAVFSFKDLSNFAAFERRLKNLQSLVHTHPVSQLDAWPASVEVFSLPNGGVRFEQDRSERVFKTIEAAAEFVASVSAPRLAALAAYQDARFERTEQDLRVKELQAELRA